MNVRFLVLGAAVLLAACSQQNGESVAEAPPDTSALVQKWVIEGSPDVCILDLAEENRFTFGCEGAEVQADGDWDVFKGRLRLLFSDGNWTGCGYRFEEEKLVTEDCDLSLTYRPLTDGE